MNQAGSLLRQWEAQLSLVLRLANAASDVIYSIMECAVAHIKTKDGEIVGRQGCLELWQLKNGTWHHQSWSQQSSNRKPERTQAIRIAATEQERALTRSLQAPTVSPADASGAHPGTPVQSPFLCVLLSLPLSELVACSRTGELPFPLQEAYSLS